MQNIFFLAIGGMLGAIARYGVSGLISRGLGSGFPWGTVAVNLLGCLLIGFFSSLFETRWQVPIHLRLLILTGFMGSFTTFSTFALESSLLLRDGQWIWCFANLALQNIAGLGLVLLGIAIGRSLAGA